MTGWAIRAGKPRRLVAALIAAIAAIPAAAHAEGRVALVVGNAAYTAAVGPLANPVKDAALIADALTARQFAVTRAANLNRVDLLAAIDAYARKLAAAGPGAVGFVYYSGHGAANPDNGRNYLIPVDARSAADSTLWYQSVPLQDIVETISKIAPQAANIVVFDACREALRLPGGKGLGDSGKGLHREEARPSVLIAFSTSPDAIAADLDRSAATGPYATELAAALAKPGVDLEAMFSDVKYGVISRTGEKQVPYIENGLRARVVLGGVTARPAAAITANAPGDPADEDARDWARAFRAGTRAAFTAYLEGRPTGLFAGEARQRIAAIDHPAAPPATQIAMPPRIAPTAQPGTGEDPYARWGLIRQDFFKVGPDLDDTTRFFRTKGFQSRLVELQKSATNNDAGAQVLLGLSYLTGQGSQAWTEKYKDAMKLFRQAANLGDPVAMTLLGDCFHSSLGVENDDIEAMQWYQKAANAGDPNAMVKIGKLYVYSMALKRDYYEAMQWFRKAAALNNSYAMVEIGSLYNLGQGVPSNPEEAFRWYKKAINAGNPDAIRFYEKYKEAIGAKD